MVIFTMVIGLKMLKMVLVNICTKALEIHIKEIGQIIKKMVMEFTCIKMEIDIKVILKMVKKMALEL